MELTFNLDKIANEIMTVVNFSELRKLNPKEPWEIFIKPRELEKVIESSFTTDSRTIRKFIDDTFGIDMTISNTSNRNRLNEMIQKIAPTKRGQRTKLNYRQYKYLILSEEFSRFILKNHNEKQSKDRNKMYDELMFLQTNKFKEKLLYKEQKKMDIAYYAKALSLVDGLDQVLKKYYWLFLDIWHNHNDYYGNIIAPDEVKQILDIISYRFRQKSETVYKFDSKKDVYSTNKEQMLQFFLEDIDRWANEEIK